MFQKHRKSRGMYITVSEYGAMNNKESVVIPEGQQQWEWRGIKLDS